MSLIPIITPRRVASVAQFGTAFSIAHQSTGSTGASKDAILQKILPGRFNGLTGTHIKIVVGLPLAGSMIITAARVGFLTGTSSSITYDGNQLPVTWDGGQSGGTFTLAGPNPEPDEIPFAIPTLTKAIMFSFDIAANCNWRYRSSQGTSFISYLKSNVEEAANTAKSGYTATAGRLAIVSQLLIGA